MPRIFRLEDVLVSIPAQFEGSLPRCSTNCCKGLGWRHEWLLYGFPRTIKRALVGHMSLCEQGQKHVSASGLG